jgi:hypothetical protein
MEIQNPEYFLMKATMVISYARGLTSIDVKKYQQSATWQPSIDRTAESGHPWAEQRLYFFGGYINR